MTCHDCGAATNPIRPVLMLTGQHNLCPACLDARGIVPVTVIGLTEQGAHRVADYLTDVAVPASNRTLGDHIRTACRMVENQLNGQHGHVVDRRGPWHFQADACHSLALGREDFVTLGPAGLTEGLAEGGTPPNVSPSEGGIAGQKVGTPHAANAALSLPAACVTRIRAEFEMMARLEGPYRTAEGLTHTFVERGLAIRKEYGPAGSP